MSFIDIFTIPVYSALIIAIAFYIKPYVTNNQTKKYFLPALGIKMFGAVALGLIYTFYYSGGDTINYFNNAKTIVDGILSTPISGLKVLLHIDDYSNYEFYNIRSKVWYYNDESSYAIVQLCTILNLISFKSYGATALLFACISFSGIWMMFYTFCYLKPSLYKEFSIGVLFIPTIVFWGSGIMKDPICISALGWLFYGVYRIMFFPKSKVFGTVIILLFSIFILYKIKVYIVLCFLPVSLYWFFLEKTNFKNKNIKFFVRPFLLAIGIGISLFALTKFSESSDKYNFEDITRTVQVTSQYLGWVSKQQDGSGYTLSHTFDGSISSLITLIPEAFNVTYFRPYLWESRKPIMLLSALESFALLIYFLMCIYKLSRNIKQIKNIPAVVVVSLIFVFLFGIAIGIF